MNYSPNYMYIIYSHSITLYYYLYINSKEEKNKRKKGIKSNLQIFSKINLYFYTVTIVY